MKFQGVKASWVCPGASHSPCLSKTFLATPSPLQYASTIIESAMSRAACSPASHIVGLRPYRCEWCWRFRRRPSVAPHSEYISHCLRTYLAPNPLKDTRKTCTVGLAYCSEGGASNRARKSPRVFHNTLLSQVIDSESLLSQAWSCHLICRRAKSGAPPRAEELKMKISLDSNAQGSFAMHILGL